MLSSGSGKEPMALMFYSPVVLVLNMFTNVILSLPTLMRGIILKIVVYRTRNFCIAISMQENARFD